jgi:hypothetical protein
MKTFWLPQLSPQLLFLWPRISKCSRSKEYFVVCSLEAPQTFVKITAALFHAFWVEKKPIQLPTVFRDVLTDKLGEQFTMRIEQRVTISKWFAPERDL